MSDIKQHLSWWHLFYAVFAALNLFAFFTSWDVDKLVIAALFLTCGIWHWCVNGYEAIVSEIFGTEKASK